MTAQFSFPAGRDSDAVSFAAGSLVQAHTAAVRATLVRRRSMSQALRLGLLASFNVIQDRLDDHLAVTLTTLTGLNRQVPDPLAVRIHSLLQVRWCRYLEQVGALHDSAWTYSTVDLGRFVRATFIGLIRRYDGPDDVEQTRELLTLLAFDLAQHAHRRNRHTGSAAAAPLID